jgi:Na+-translocating ferredoxin:NAD+ oxidoreductase RnfG subunit
MARRPEFRWLIPAGLLVVPAYHAAYAVQYLTVDQAQRSAFPQASDFTVVALSRGMLDRTAAALGEPAPAGWAPKIWEARAGEQRLGWLIVDQVIGKTDAITFALALGPDGAVTSLEILEYREAHGGEVRLPAWRRQFTGRRAKDPVRVGSDIRNISGATLSCRHVTDGVRRLLSLYEQVLRPVTK